MGNAQSSNSDDVLLRVLKRFPELLDPFARAEAAKALKPLTPFATPESTVQHGVGRGSTHELARFSFQVRHLQCWSHSTNDDRMIPTPGIHGTTVPAADGHSTIRLLASLAEQSLQQACEKALEDETDH